MDYRIVDVFINDFRLCVKADHYHPDGSFWFTEHYTFLGREGLKQKQATDAQGNVLMDDGTPAPTRAGGRVPINASERIPYLPSGRSWKYRPGPHMSDNSILEAISSIHKQRLVTGWPQGKVDSLKPRRASSMTQADRDGCAILNVAFQHLIGYEA